MGDISLREYVDRRVDELDRRIDTRLCADEKRRNDQLKAQEVAILLLAQTTKDTHDRLVKLMGVVIAAMTLLVLYFKGG